MAIKLPKLWPYLGNGTFYVYLDANNTEWTYSKGITTTDSAIGQTVTQMYAPTKGYNNVNVLSFITNHNLYSIIVTT